MTIGEALIGDFRNEAEMTRRVLASVPEDRLDWQPHEKSMSLGQLVGHVAETPGWVHAMLADELDFDAGGSDYQPFVAEDRAGLLEAHDANAAGFEAALEGRDDDFFRATWTMRRGDTVLMSMVRGWAIRSTCIHHLVHHRGQLTVYLRMLGVPVPQTYGPTADFPDFG
ncbi:MAG: DinB family protein [Gemmatimonadota bacterium]